jgi:hypothetical protein
VAYSIKNLLQKHLATIESQARTTLLLLRFRTLYFLRDGKGRRICVIEKFCWRFFLLVFNDLQNLSGNTVIPAANVPLYNEFSMKKRLKSFKTIPPVRTRAVPEGVTQKVNYYFKIA